MYDKSKSTLRFFKRSAIKKNYNKRRGDKISGKS